MLSKRYIPPCLSISASPVLAGLLREIRDLLTAKGRELREYKRQQLVHTMEMGSRDTVYLLMMQMVNRYIPLFHHYLEVEETHPCPMYALLRQMIGEFSTFSEASRCWGAPAYRHDQLWECFDAAIRVVKELLSELTKGPEYVVPLVFDGAYFAASLDKRFLKARTITTCRSSSTCPRARLSACSPIQGRSARGRKWRCYGSVPCLAWMCAISRRPRKSCRDAPIATTLRSIIAGRAGVVLSSAKISPSCVNSRQTRQKCSCWSWTIPSKALSRRGTTRAREPEGRKDEAA